RWTATDDCGNAASVAQTFDVLPDTEAPSFTVPAAITIDCSDDPNDLTITGNVTDAADNCSSGTLTPTYSDFSTITVNARGQEGVEIFDLRVNGTSIGTQLVTQTPTAYDFTTTISPISTIEVHFINDESRPGFDANLIVDNIVFNSVTYESEDPSVYSEGSWDPSNGCAGGFEQSEWLHCDGFLQFSFSGECPGAGTIYRQWTLTDDCGNVNNQVQTITVQDNTPPVISNTPNDTLVACTVCIGSFLNEDFEQPAHPDGASLGQIQGGASNSYVIWHENDVPGWQTTASDNEIELHASGTDGMVAASGTQFAELNASSNSDFYQEFCTVPNATMNIRFAHGKRSNSSNTTDDIMGLFIGPDLNNLTNVLTATATEFQTWTYYSHSYVIPAGQNSTIVLFRAIQGSPGNIQEGNVIDDINVHMFFGGNTPPVATDNCSTASLVGTVDDYVEDLCNGYNVVYRWEATDECGNVTETSQTITVAPDSEAPTFTTTPSAIADISCGATFPVPQNLTATDNCGNITVTPTTDAYVVDNCNGYTVTYRWTASDDCGNNTEITQSFNVLPDNSVPVFDSTPSAISDIACDALLPTQEVLSASDNCGNVGVVPSIDSYTVDNCAGYVITYRWTATDDCGNIAEVTQSFNVLPDNDAPVFASAPSVIGDISCAATFPVQEVLSASDNCGTTNVLPSIDSYVVDNCNGYTVTYRWTAIDDCGNLSEVTDRFNVLPDSDAPVFDSAPSVIGDISCDASFPTQEVLSASDNCETTNVLPSIDAYVVDNCNGYTVTYRWTSR
ncbi:MAG: carbohydrate-binding domain-containing protein, partial [Bacteroidota bacterium]